MSLLTRLGHQVTLAQDGQAAVDAYRVGAFDLILMEVQMPVLSGYDATCAIRQIEATSGAHIPIVAMTARAMQGDRQRCLDVGMDDYVSKPVQGKLLVEVIRRTVNVPSLPLDPSAPAAIDEAAALALADGDPALLREVKDLCVTETPYLLDEIDRALSAAQPAASSAAAHALRGMYLVFGPNEVVTIAGGIEELALARDMGGAAAACGPLRSAAERVTAAFGSRGPVALRVEG